MLFNNCTNMDAYKKYLAENVLSEEKIVTYRLLSRALHVHPNTAKQMLYEFHKSQNGKRPGAVHATYVVYGIKNAENVKNGADGDIEMTSSMPDVESFDDVVPTFTLALVQEEKLKDTLAEYDEVSSIHVYSLGPSPTKDLSLLADVAQQALTLGDSDSKTVVITNDKVRRRERKAGAAKAAKTAPATTAAKVVKQEAKAVKHDPKAALSKVFAAAKPKAEVKEEAQSENPHAESKKPALSVPDKKSTPALKRGGSNTSSIMQAFSKAATKVKKAETSQPATPSGDDSTAQPMSDDGEDDSEMPQPASRGTTGRKTRKEREEELRRMMEEDDDDDDDEEAEERAESPEDPMDETPEEPAAPEPAQEERAELVTSSADGRRRGKRKVMRKKQIMDEQGYLVTIQEPSWESFSEDEAPPPATKSKTAISSAPPSQASKAKKSGPKGNQGNIMSFFSKK